MASQTEMENGNRILIVAEISEIAALSQHPQGPIAVGEVATNACIGAKRDCAAGNVCAVKVTELGLDAVTVDCPQAACPNNSEGGNEIVSIAAQGTADGLHRVADAYGEVQNATEQYAASFSRFGMDE